LVHWFADGSRFRWAWRWIDEAGLRCVETLKDLVRPEIHSNERFEALYESADLMLTAFEEKWDLYWSGQSSRGFFEEESRDSEERIRRFHNAAGQIIGILEELEKEVLTAVLSTVPLE